MGYNPFKPHMSFSGGAGAGTTCLPPAAPALSSGSQPSTPLSVSAAGRSPPPPPDAVASSGNTIGLSPDEYDDFVAEMVSEVDDSFAMLLSLGMIIQL